MVFSRLVGKREADDDEAVSACCPNCDCELDDAVGTIGIHSFTVIDVSDATYFEDIGAYDYDNVNTYEAYTLTDHYCGCDCATASNSEIQDWMQQANESALVDIWECGKCHTHFTNRDNARSCCYNSN